MVRIILPPPVGCRRDCKICQPMTWVIASVGHILVIAVPCLTNRSFTTNDNVRSQGFPGAVCQRRRACIDRTGDPAGRGIAVQVQSVAHRVKWDFEKRKSRSKNVGSSSQDNLGTNQCYGGGQDGDESKRNHHELWIKV